MSLCATVTGEGTETVVFNGSPVSLPKNNFKTISLVVICDGTSSHPYGAGFLKN